MVLQKTKKFQFVLIKRFDESIHGKDLSSSKDIEFHFICHYIFKTNENIWREIKNSKNSVRYHFEKEYQIRDSLHIAEVIMKDNEERVAILKTFWLRIFFRICLQFLKTKKRMKNIHYLRRRELV
jgi:hypothetical protein